MKTNKCFFCHQETRFVKSLGSDVKGFVECSSALCMASGPTDLNIRAVAKWNQLANMVKDHKQVVARNKLGRGFFPLTLRQKETLVFCIEFIEEHNKAPTIREMSAHFKICTSSIRKHLTALEDKEYIRRPYNRDRNVEILRGV